MAVTLESLKKSVGKKNSKSKIFAWLADMELAAGELDNALQRVNGGLTLYPNDISAKLVRAKILFQKEEFEGCVQECESTLVMDPFNLAAQKIMGDAYDKLGNVAERNLCYRRYHDMDPLNKFWKDEYDVVLETAPVAAAAAVAETDFSLPAEEDESLDFGKSIGESLDLGLSEPEQEDGSSLFEKSFSDQNASEGANEEFSFSSASSSDDSLGGGLFDKSNDDSLFGGDESVEEKSTPFSSSFLDDESDEQTPAAGPSEEDELPFGAVEESSDDPFAALAAMLPNSDSSDDATFDDLTASLDSVMDAIKAGDDIDKPVEQFPVDDNVSGNDVNAALSDMFGLDDDLEAEEIPAPKASDFGSFVDEAAEQNASKIFETQSSADASADKPLSVDDAFASIFGDDELPEEMPASAPAAKPAFVEEAPAAPVEEDDSLGMSSFEKSAIDEPTFSESSFEQSASSSIFEKATELDMDAPSVAPIEESAEAAIAPASPIFQDEPVAAPAAAPAPADKPLSVDDAFSSIFGDDELPEELPAFEKSASSDLDLDDSLDAPMFEKSALNEPALNEPALNEPALSEPEPVAENVSAAEDVSVAAPTTLEETPSFASDVFDLSEDSLSLDDTLSELPAAEEKMELPAVEKVTGNFPVEEELETPAAEEPKFVAEVDVPSDPVIASPMDFMDNDDTGVGNAFSSIFGDDDDLPEENPAPAIESANDVVESLAADGSLAEQIDKAESALEMPTAETQSNSSDIAQEMGGAFASMFGDDDDLDLPDLGGEPKVEAAENPQSTSAALEEAISSFAPAEANISNDLDKSFDSLFGSDDDLDMPAAPAAAAVVEEEKPVAGNPDLASLETEVSGAFKGLFDMEDDSFTEEPKPSSSGVDFLMSGDSDDEISAGLAKNPDAPLNRGSLNLDDSMGTRTLAEIYFDQGLYADALKMYQELALREPENEELIARKEEIERICREKFGGNI